MTHTLLLSDTLDSKFESVNSITSEPDEYIADTNFTNPITARYKKIHFSKALHEYLIHNDIESMSVYLHRNIFILEEFYVL